MAIKSKAGRPVDAASRAAIQKCIKACKTYTAKEIADLVGCSRATVYAVKREMEAGK